MSLEISELMDGEADEHAAERVFAALRENEQQRLKWEHYHVIGDALRGTALRDAQHDSRLQARVFAALAQEPTVLAPRPQPKRTEAPRWQRYSVAAAAVLAVFGLMTWFAPLQQMQAPPQVAQGQSSALRALASNASLPAGGSQALMLPVGSPAGANPILDDPYLEAHFDVSPTIRQSVMRAGWRPNDQR